MKHKIVILSIALFLLCLSCEKDKNFEAGGYMYEGQQLFNIIPNAVCDVDGNSYDAVKIGKQIWMKQNLRTTKYADGTPIVQGSDTSSSQPYWYYVNNDVSNTPTYGLLYNWKAVMRNSYSSDANPSGVQGICPNGWHVPSSVEWDELIEYVGSQSRFVCDNVNGNIAKALASPIGWGYSPISSTPGNSPHTNNATGFSVLPAGCYYGGNSGYHSFGCFWSATELRNGRMFAWSHSLDYNMTELRLIGYYYKWFGLSVRCVRNEDGEIALSVPTVTTSSVTSIAATTAICGGIVTDDGGATVTARGVCWSRNHNPTISGNHTSDGNGTGRFISNISGLIAGATYYVRAYATNSEGTAYGDELTFTTPTLPTVTTTAVTNIDATSATSGGIVTDDGEATVTARGVCWSIRPNPTTSNSHTTDGNGTGSFISNLTRLYAGTTFYVRAYATNSEGTSYGNEVSFTTTGSSSLTCGTSTLTDIDGNTYHTVLIGSQCWMKENLRTTKYANGISIAQGGSSTSNAYWYYPNNNSSNKPTYGLLYNWRTVMGNSSSSSDNPSGVQGICPNGWHVPSDAEWTQLTDYVSSQSRYVCGNDNTYIAKALAGTMGWSSSTTTCAVGNTPNNNDATGFSGLPAGGYYGNCSGFGDGAIFWSSTMQSSGYAYALALEYNNISVHRFTPNKNNGYSVRCVKD